ncbi:hypothetical protein EWM64_g1718 [Hericium alpestre]|uniref:Uncharacterized protein n=1 Tax=Hericium alpestre TaxID=135208 RepID=A0A4Z0A7P9_9AGAM|nr:hypothetical protein EWM64_g1718 [Hericium alpestre]
MRKLAARDFEDLLQCAMPVFENLLGPPYDNIIQDLLFDLATWHALAKLRLHTDLSLEDFRTATTLLGQTVRKFVKKVCPDWDTRELPKEYAARGRRRQARTNQSGQSASTKELSTALGTKKRKTLNLLTYKWHSLGDYPDSIPYQGTTDSYSTQWSELEHRRSKRRFARSSKNNFVPQLAKQDVRERLIRRVQRRLDRARKEASLSAKMTGRRKEKVAANSDDPSDDPLPHTDPASHYHIAASARDHVDIPTWLAQHSDDPATEDFLPNLKSHLLARLRDVAYTGDEHSFTDEELDTILFAEDRMYQHKVLRINYTSYDLRRQQDSINPRTRADIMVLAHDTSANPYWYARVIGIFHFMVQLRGSLERPQRMDVLWVRWFGLDVDAPHGFAARRLPHIGFINQGPEAFGFLDPQVVIRGVHLIPHFSDGCTSDLLDASIARQPQEQDEDWAFHYVNIFVDRDMFMRFRGGGVGHKGTRHLDKILLADKQGGRPGDGAGARDNVGGRDSSDSSEEQSEGEQEGHSSASKAGSDDDDSEELHHEDDHEDEDEDEGHQEESSDSEEDLDPVERDPSDDEVDEDILEQAGFAPL